MSANLIEATRTCGWLRSSRSVAKRHQRQERIERNSIPMVRGDEEIKLITSAVIWMGILGVTPLILFHIINVFYPDMFLIPVAPN